MWTDDHHDLLIPFPDDMPPAAKVVTGTLAVVASVTGVAISHALLRNFGDTISAVAGVLLGVALAAVVLVVAVAVCRAVRVWRRRRACRVRVDQPDERKPPVVG